MKNEFIYKFQSSIKLSVKGKNVERFVRRLINQKIELLEVYYPQRNEVIIKIYKKDYDKLEEIKTVYDIDIIDSYGMIKLKKIVSINNFVIFFIIIGLGLLFFLSNIIFEIEVVHTDKELRTLILNELKEKGIKEKSFKKSFAEIQEIKKSIVNKYKEKIEWLEIEIVGTKYIIRIQERKLPEINDRKENRNIISNRSAIIRSIEAKNGEIIKNINDYVKPGDVIISGEIRLNDETKKSLRAEGSVYGEVWYNTTVEYPLIYSEEKPTGKKKKVLVLEFLGHKIELFNFNSYKNKTREGKVILKNNFLPIKILWETQKEVNVIEEFNTEEEAINKAIELAEQKMKSKLNDNEYIINQNCLKVNIRNSTIEVDMFFAIYENITAYQKIEEEILEEKLE